MNLYRYHPDEYTVHVTDRAGIQPIGHRLGPRPLALTCS